MNLTTLAQTLDQAAYKAKAVPQLSIEHPITEQDAYVIQAASLAERYARGERYIGVKMGFTSKAKMEQMGVHDMIWGRLTDKMLIPNGGKLEMDEFIHPRVEPELCFLVKKAITGPISLSEVRTYIEAVAPAMEIIDSRFENFKFSLADVVADNCSSAAFVLGKWHAFGTDLSDLKMELIIDGEVAQSGSSAAILGNPLESFIAAARLTQQYEQALPAGSIVLAGAATSAVYLKKDQQIETRVAELGDLSFYT